MTPKGVIRTACVLATVGALVTPSLGLAQSITYGYDALGRLTAAAYPGGQLVTYSYDAAGNRTEVTTSAPPPPVPLSASVTATSYTRTAGSVPSLITCKGNGGTVPYTYWWQFVSGVSVTKLTTDGSAVATGWYHTVPSTSFRISTWRCRATDPTSATATATATSPTVAVSIRTN
ncbi:RHS repeat domain-containing protein [Brevundimonas sp. FT23028]|uniref:RHS repeat domain-containing protein n=1 Tax=Brevundimonas sp. FT23028 TaxID=3393748 RepID=UPI003B58A0AA